MSSVHEPRIRWTAVLLSTVVTVIALFVLQEWYRTFTLLGASDMSAPAGEEFAGLRDGQLDTLRGGPMPIDRAIQTLATRGRRASALLLPEPSTDAAPAAGWMHHPRFEGLPPAPAEPAPEEPLGPAEPGETEPAAPGETEPAEPGETEPGETGAPSAEPDAPGAAEAAAPSPAQAP